MWIALKIKPGAKLPVNINLKGSSHTAVIKSYRQRLTGFQAIVP